MVLDGSYLRVFAELEVPVWQVALLAGAALLFAGKNSSDDNNSSSEQAVADNEDNTSASTNTSATAVKANSIKKDDDSLARQALSAGTKLVLVVRNDLALPKGTVAQLCAQVTLECFAQARQLAPRVLREWERTGQAKVTLKCLDCEEISKLQREAELAGLVAASAADTSGNNSGSSEPAVLGIGPGPINTINTVSGGLKLY
ncbi:hypothetical protein GGI11_003669 [Coemansia sp. RSA 2049]|nr:hypothetical protein GGI11_003669 [Coemansia sp. RSA 2049]KAJ2522213.1 hypothetical protein H4217_000904 [Coemansia sp. RSA 1939]KAJ2617821.1 hypothetical protein EV177_000357 [Coemansia sp. RSA 1804]KAJ2695199.1 hypothetical protein GGH99_000276 [Coemansia sp. RSA 1285]